MSPLNARRLTETWFKDHKALVTRIGEYRSLEQATDNTTFRSKRPNKSVATVQSVALNYEKCKDLAWFLKTVSMGSMLLPAAMDSIRQVSLERFYCSSSLGGLHAGEF